MRGRKPLVYRLREADRQYLHEIRADGQLIQRVANRARALLAYGGLSGKGFTLDAGRQSSSELPLRWWGVKASAAYLCGSCVVTVLDVVS